MNTNLFSAQAAANLSYTTQDSAKRAVMEVLARHNVSDDNLLGDSKSDDSLVGQKRKADTGNDAFDSSKCARPNDSQIEKTDGKSSKDDVPPGKEGTPSFNDNDVLCGRGGGTNVHPGNRRFRELINNHRRSYLRARKNDKPAISKSIVRQIRECNGRFLKKDEKSGLWFEVGDDSAREKTSQALRQRAPEMRRILFDAEQGAHNIEYQLQQQQLLASTLLTQQAAQFPLAGFVAPTLATQLPSLYLLNQPNLPDQLLPQQGQQQQAMPPQVLQQGLQSQVMHPHQMMQQQAIQQQQVLQQQAQVQQAQLQQAQAQQAQAQQAQTQQAQAQQAQAQQAQVQQVQAQQPQPQIQHQPQSVTSDIHIQQHQHQQQHQQQDQQSGNNPLISGLMHNPAINPFNPNAGT
eukprot:CAMPEP_0118682290 /NCGR_PEP_ID=MMETSP0800-20121206/5407_1 /TAXON_ID=210618 ORGANISM="Striatella unipunctata, Strain CCMP2910" /NCGR_SAMPLE_ID=MMETSP0800 /ASSEMBLY_ACC=CAM_ASM_000638 /LENGTH=404 /DNA_ID=CAMNT_0006578671 /DNA_START=77 /DNA_END=1291 /DNA_ORIENTATION=+